MSYGEGHGSEQKVDGTNSRKDYKLLYFQNDTDRLFHLFLIHNPNSLKEKRSKVSIKIFQIHLSKLQIELLWYYKLPDRIKNRLRPMQKLSMKNFKLNIEKQKHVMESVCTLVEPKSVFAHAKCSAKTFFSKGH